MNWAISAPAPRAALVELAQQLRLALGGDLVRAAARSAAGVVATALQRPRLGPLAAQRRGRLAGGALEVGGVEPVDVGEVGGAAAEHPHPGALLGARLHRLDPRLVDRHRQAARGVRRRPRRSRRRWPAPGRGRARRRSGSISAAHGFGRFPATSISRPGGDEQLAAGRRVGGVVAGPAARVVEAGEGPARRRGGGACRRPPRRRSRRRGRAGRGAASAASARARPAGGEVAQHRAHVEEAAARRGRSARSPRPRPGRRGAGRRPRPARCAMWTCSTGSPPARSATSNSAAASSRQRSGSPLAASTAPSAPRIAPPRRSGDISVR